MTRVFSFAIAVISAVLSGAVDYGSEMAAEDTADVLILDDFTGGDASPDWRTVNDNIMGGRSVGGGEIIDGVMVFSGSINTNGGGFSSIRTNGMTWDLSDYNGLGARIRADGRRYVFHVNTGLTSNNGNVFYRGEFKTDALIDADGKAASDAESWQRVFVAFSDFVPMIRGRDVTGRVESLDPAKIRGVGFMIDDGVDGLFRLEADWIRAELLPSGG